MSWSLSWADSTTEVPQRGKRARIPPCSNVTSLTRDSGM